MGWECTAVLQLYIPVHDWTYVHSVVFQIFSVRTYMHTYLCGSGLLGHAQVPFYTLVASPVLPADPLKHITWSFTVTTFVSTFYDTISFMIESNDAMSVTHITTCVG